MTSLTLANIRHSWLPVMLTALLLTSGISISRLAHTAPLPPVTTGFFGLHIHRTDAGTAWPTVPFGSWRLWDAYVGWAQLEPERGKWDFSRLDKYTAMAALTKTDLLLPLAMTPQWASARPAEPSGYRPGNVAEPADMADWRNYVQTVGQRYKGKIRLYEVWNEPSDKNHYTGSVEKLVELTCEAYRILKVIDPAIRMVSPASAGPGKHIDYLDRFLSLGGKQCIDIVAHHFYVPRFAPEAMVPIIRQVKQVMQRHGVAHLPLWNTETGGWIENGDGTPDHPMVAKGGWRKLGLAQESGAFLQRAFLLARAEGIERFYWYSWDNRYGLGMIEPTTGAPKPMVESWRQIAGWMLGKTVTGCAQQGTGWSCDLRDSDGKGARITWQDDDALQRREGMATTPVPQSAIPQARTSNQ